MKPQKLHTRGGRTVIIRPVTRDDLPALLDFIRRLSPETRYRRFYIPLPDPPREDIVQQLGETLLIPPERGVALVATQDDEVIGTAHFVHEPHTSHAEAAVVVRDDCQGEGIGTELLRQLADLAQHRGIRVLYAYVQPDNERVLRLVRKIHYPLRTTFDRGLVRIEVWIDGRGNPKESPGEEG